MKNFFLSCLFVITSLPCFSQAGRPFAIWEDQSISVYKYVRLDAATGTKTELATIPGVLAFVSGDRTAYDAANNYYHFSALSGSGLILFYTINASTGGVIYNPVIPFTLYGLEYNCADGMLYGVRNNSGVYDIVRIDPVTAAATSVASVGALSGYVSSSASLDPVQGYYTFKSLVSSTYMLRTYDLSTGAMVANVLFPDNVTGLRYSCADNAIYGLWDNGGGYKLERVSPLTGTHTTIGTLAGVDPGHVVESNSADPSGYYTFRGFDTSGSFRLFTVDLSSASVTASSLTTDNAVGFEEANCCSLPTSVEENKENEFSIYPVPGIEQITIEHNANAERMEIFSSDGKRMLMCDLLGRQQKVNTSEWPAGIYLVRIISKDKTIQKKFIVSK